MVKSMKDYNTLIHKAIESKKYAYVPYSNFRVGSATLTDKGNIYSGCNIENASYGATNCAERTAIFKGVSIGDSNIIALAIATDKEGFITPCGICRQVIREFGDDVEIILINKNGQTQYTNIEELFPKSFSKEQIKGEINE